MHRATLFKFALSLCAMVMASPALAQSGLYVSATGGALFPNEWGSDSGIRTSFKTGYSVLGAVGLSIGLIGLRIEAEGGYRQSDVDKVSVAGASLPGSGSAKVESGMVNAYFEFPYSIGAVRPYIGAGLGAARVFGSHIGTGGGTTIDGHDTVLAYQGMAGFAYSMTSHLAMTVGYRYFATDTARLSATIAGASVPAKQNGLKTHSAELGLRFTF